MNKDLKNLKEISKKNGQNVKSLRKWDIRRIWIFFWFMEEAPAGIP
ncbi:MAG: hypothetical protein ACLVDZ_00570 [Ruminococcus sp.]